MFQKMMERFHDFFEGKRVGGIRIIESSEFFEREWQSHQPAVMKKLGSTQDILKTLSDLDAKIGNVERPNCFGGRYRLSEVIQGFKRDIESIKSDTVGDPENVSYLFPPALKIGYAIYQSKDNNFTCEVIESLDRIWKILGRRGKVIAVCIIAVMRQESSGCEEII